MGLEDKRWVIHLAFISILLAPIGCSAHRPQPAEDIELGEEYSDFSKPSRISNLPEEAFTKEERSWPFKVTSYTCDRILDFIDVFKIDVGFGPSRGFVARITKYGQMGVRRMKPGSLRFGLRGRDWPVFLERVDESGYFQNFNGTPSREVSQFELGAGIDLFLAGAYVGLSVDGLFDFLTGFVGIDVSGDDGALYR